MNRIFYECYRVNIIDKKIAKGKDVGETCMSKIIKVNNFSIKNGWEKITPSPKYSKNASGALFIIGAQ